MSDELLLISSWAGFVPVTLQAAAVSGEKEMAVSPIRVFFSHIPRIWWTILSATEKRQNTTLSSNPLASPFSHIKV